jgi:glycosyl transferase, family 25
MTFDTEEVIRSGLYSEVLSKKNHRFGRKLEGGMLGCSWSHRMVYEDILAKGFKKVMILEDDVRLRPGSFESFLKAMEELPADWDILWLDYYNNEKTPVLGGLKKAWYHIQHRLGALTYSHKTIDNLYALPYSEHLLKSGFHDFTDAYAISQQGAVQLLKMQTPIQWLADNLLAAASTEGSLQAFCLREKLFYQTSQTTAPDQSMISDRQP